MALPIANFPTISFDDANPFLTAFGRGQSLMKNQLMMPQELKKIQLANAISQAQANVAPQMEQARLATEQSRAPYMQAQTGLIGKQTQWYDPEARARIALQGAQAGLAGSEAAKNKFMLSNPAYMIGGMPAQIAYLKSQGIDLFGDNQQQQPNQPQQMQQGQGGSSPFTNSLQQTMMQQQAQQGQQGGQQQPEQSAITPMTGFGGGAMGGAPNQKDMMKNMILYGSPLNPQEKMQMQIQQDQQKKMADYGTKKIQSLAQDSIEAQNTDNLLNQIEKSYADSTLKGWKYTDVDTKNLIPRALGGALALKDKNLDPEQRTDVLSAQLQQTLAKRMGNLTNGKIAFAGMQKLSRSMGENAFKDTLEQFRAANARTKEEQQFYNAALSNGYTPQIADALFNTYMQQNPIADQSGKIVKSKNTWQDYLTPQAAQAVMSGRKYVPPKSSVKKITEEDIQHTAKKRGISIEQVRRDAISKGLL